MYCKNFYIYLQGIINFKNKENGMTTVKVKHKFIGRPINKDTEILIIGTFNPDTPKNPAEFFYGRIRNFLWKLLPTVYGEKDLKKASKQEKLTFIEKYKIDFIDLIQEIEVEQGQEANFDDKYIDGKVIQWADVITEIDRLKNLKKVCFTRKTFDGIPKMRKKIEEIQSYCNDKKIPFKALVTPARFYNEDRQREWTSFLSNE